MANLVETASQAGSFTTLLAAAEAAGLVDFLNGPGPFTILAPTDDAFAALPEGTVDALLQDVPKLKRILMYHVLPGEVLAENLAELEEAETEEGSVVAIEHGDSLKVNEATVTKTDILADNGVIHIIDGVIMPAMLAGGT
ncbi:fasciclin domain-containing protein [Microcoleus sp. FACHB-1515]|uniref:fasciclin domain-containing protein n=1 Tax=Cyanophyceae TaxID=3028117 RepID=UPI001681D789|nr:fasciclin domain-containing protein [Microcoleus sp. FACHB-1515]MBD2091649.1 fasciclin domain-containing protein [Microcoleus sp. FACHB-1515]